jgi:hypothetical protein
MSVAFRIHASFRSFYPQLKSFNFESKARLPDICMDRAPNVSPAKIEDGEAIDLFGIFTSVTLDPIGKIHCRCRAKKLQALNRFSGPPESH